MGHAAPRARRLAAVVAAVAAWASLAAPVAAHEQEVIRYGSFLGGFFHPVLGPDHLLAMLSVGIVSTMIGGRAILTVPAMFVTAMAIGGIVGVVNAFIPMGIIEAGIAASVIVLGLVIAGGRRVPWLAAMAAVSVFGFMHGYAHGVETPAIASPEVYALGFLLGTATIHLFGVLIGEVARKYPRGVSALRVAGGVIAAIGVLFLFGVL